MQKMWHILLKHFVSWAIIQYSVSTRLVKMDLSPSKYRLVYRGLNNRLQPYNNM